MIILIVVNCSNNFHSRTTLTKRIQEMHYSQQMCSYHSWPPTVQNISTISPAITTYPTLSVRQERNIGLIKAKTKAARDLRKATTEMEVLWSGALAQLIIRVGKCATRPNKNAPQSWKKLVLSGQKTCLVTPSQKPKADNVTTLVYPVSLLALRIFTGMYFQCGWIINNL